MEGRPTRRRVGKAGKVRRDGNGRVPRHGSGKADGPAAVAEAVVGGLVWTA